MLAPAPLNDDNLNISAVERETGLSKEVLRKWETRYGFPSPDRDFHGERIYPSEQVERLRIIKRLLDTGVRPAGIVKLQNTELRALAEQRVTEPASFTPEPLITQLMAYIRAHDSAGLYTILQRQLLTHGLSRFVMDIAIPLILAVGDAWARGDIPVYEEHIFSNAMQNILRHSAEILQDPNKKPRVLLTTPPDEQHGLGILMVNALFSLEGASCLSLGTQTPMADIQLAVENYPIDIVGLSVSIAYPARRIVPLLEELRQRLPEKVEIWAGGAGIERLGKPIPGISTHTNLAAARIAIQRWKAEHAQI